MQTDFVAVSLGLIISISVRLLALMTEVSRPLSEAGASSACGALTGLEVPCLDDTRYHRCRQTCKCLINVKKYDLLVRARDSDLKHMSLPYVCM